MFTSAHARPARGAAIAAAGALALGIAACGSDEASDSDPASAVPATAPMYFEATIRPDGDLKDDAEAALGKILGTDDPAAEIDKLLDQSGEGGDTSYKEDVEPWLGETMAGFVTGISADSADGAVLISSTDDDAAREALTKDADGAQEQTYEDVTYWVDGDTVFSVTDGYVVVGTERGFRTVVDTIKGDVDTIDDSADYESALDAVGGDDDALAVFYVDTPGLIDAVARSGGIPQDQVEALRDQLAEAGGEAAVAKFGVTESAISIESAAIGLEGEGDDAGDAAAAVAALPGDSWLALGIPGIGENLRSTLDQIAEAGNAGGQDVDALIRQVEAMTGLNLEQDLLSWMGDGALFVRGSGIADIGGALVVETSDEQATNGAIVKVAELIRRQSPDVEIQPLDGVAGADEGIVLSQPGTPVQVIMATGGGKFVAGVGASAVEEALDPQTTLADSESFQAAADALGDGVEPSFFFDVAPTLRLAEGVGASGDPSFAQAKEYLDSFGSIAGGGGRDGDVQRGKLVITLK